MTYVSLLPSLPDLVDPDVEPLYVHLCLLAAVLAPLQLVQQLHNLGLVSQGHSQVRPTPP